MGSERAQSHEEGVVDPQENFLLVAYVLDLLQANYLELLHNLQRVEFWQGDLALRLIRDLCCVHPRSRVIIQRAKAHATKGASACEGGANGQL